MSYPSDFKYTKDHEWVKIEDKSVVMGITKFAQSELGDVVFVDLPPIGKTVKQGETLCVVESTKAASDVYAPVGGKVIEVNSALTAKPETINQDSFGAGWMVRLEPSDINETQTLLNLDQYSELIGGNL